MALADVISQLGSTIINLVSNTVQGIADFLDDNIDNIPESGTGSPNNSMGTYLLGDIRTTYINIPETYMDFKSIMSSEEGLINFNNSEFATSVLSKVQTANFKRFTRYKYSSGERNSFNTLYYPTYLYADVDAFYWIDGKYFGPKSPDDFPETIALNEITYTKDTENTCPIINDGLVLYDIIEQYMSDSTLTPLEQEKGMFDIFSNYPIVATEEIPSDVVQGIHVLPMQYIDYSNGELWTNISHRIISCYPTPVTIYNPDRKYIGYPVAKRANTYIANLRPRVLFDETAPCYFYTLSGGNMLHVHFDANAYSAWGMPFVVPSDGILYVPLPLSEEYEETYNETIRIDASCSLRPLTEHGLNPIICTGKLQNNIT